MAPNATTTCISTAAASLYMPQTYSFLSPETFETLVNGYINQLHIRKRNKALINQQLANDCLMVLTNPENTSIFNPKFRWWVRKHFVFTVVGELRILMDKKNGKPVCVREQLYDKVCYFHHIIGHGGRDKTFAAITKSYSKVPAELVSLFTKNCQTCLGVRKYSKNKRPILNEFEYPGQHQQSAKSEHHSQHKHYQQQQQQQQQQLQQQEQQQQYVHQQQHQQHPHPLQLTCNTGPFSIKADDAMHSMYTKSDQGIISPISPIVDHSSFFDSAHFHSAYSQAPSQHQHHVQQQQQQQHQQQKQQYQNHHQQQMQQHHHAALATHLNMSMSLSGISLGNHLTQSLHGQSHNITNNCIPSPTLHNATTSSSSPNLLSRIELPFHQLLQQHPIDTGLHSPTDLPEHPFAPQQQASSASSEFSPTLHYMTQSQSQQQQQQQDDHQQQQNSLYPSSFSSYSDALTTLSNFQQQHHSHQHQQDPSQIQQLPSSPMLSQAQIFQKQIQQEQHQHHQYYSSQQQQQHRFLPEALMNPNLTVSTSTAQSAVPSMDCDALTTTSTDLSLSSSIPTPTSDSSMSTLLEEHEMEQAANAMSMQYAEEQDQIHVDHARVAELVAQAAF